MFTVFPQIIAFSQLIAYLSNRPPGRNIQNNDLPWLIPPPPHHFCHDCFLLSSGTDQWWFKLWHWGYLDILKINQGTKFRTLKEPMFIVWFNWITKEKLWHDFQWAIFEIIASLTLTPPFLCKSNKNRPWLLFKEIRCFNSNTDWI